jgi:glucose/arabinose dehydrogenase
MQGVDMRSQHRPRRAALLLAMFAALVVTGCTRPVTSTPQPVAPQPVATVTAGPTPTDIGGFKNPTCIVTPDDSSGRMFVAEQRGTIRMLKDGVLAKTPALDIRGKVGSSGSEQGLLGLAFPKGFAQKRYAYIYFTDPSGTSQFFRVHVSASDPDTFDPATMQLILTVAQPYANHNGGQLAFGPDGYLYIGLGDGGSAGDPGHRAQSLSTLLGKILRIDVESTPDAAGYKVPADNPFVNKAGAKPEIWAYGLRNPWRFSFDSANGDLWIGDVGQDAWEEIDHVAAGSKGGLNFGWPLYEGNELYRATSKASTGFVWPVFAYTHRQGISVTGGYVYHGSAYPGMQGKYVFGDYGSGNIWTLTGSGSQYAERLARKTFYRISTFGVDGSGELWVADYAAGRIHRIDDLSQ